jgi:hypothetical protein
MNLNQILTIFTEAMSSHGDRDPVHEVVLSPVTYDACLKERGLGPGTSFRLNGVVVKRGEELFERESNSPVDARDDDRGTRPVPFGWVP